MLIKRVLAALVFAPALLAVVIYGGLPLAITCAAIALLMQIEFARMTLGPGQLFLKTVGLGFSLVVAFAVCGAVPYNLEAALLAAFATIPWVAVLARPEPIETATSRAALLVLGPLYCGGFLPFLFRAREIEGAGLGLALAALFCTWGGDSGAYFAGRFLGKRRLYPLVSPKKTVEGALGGTVASIGVAFLIRWLFDAPFGIGDAIAIGLIAGFWGIVGDLAESLLKRSVGRKDSSALIPGHGGVLDRFDAVMFVCPALFLYGMLFLSP